MQLGVETTKVTHEFRIYAAQLMYEMGVSLEVRSGLIVSWTAWRWALACQIVAMPMLLLYECCLLTGLPDCCTSKRQLCCSNTASIPVSSHIVLH